MSKLESDSRKRSLTHGEALQRAGLPTLETLTRRILRVFDRATASDVESGARWYDEAGELAITLAADAGSVEHAAAVIAHLSPRTTWARNVAAAVALVREGKSYPGAMSRNVEGARRAIAAETGADALDTLGGPKTRAFAANISGDRDAVTVDIWACRVADVDDALLSRVGVYDAIAHAYRLAAGRRGVDPATMQATCWVIQRGGRAH